LQENYANYRPNSARKDVTEITRMKAVVQAAESIAAGDLMNMQIRRCQQWQLSQAYAVLSSLIPLVP